MRPNEDTQLLERSRDKTSTNYVITGRSCRILVSLSLKHRFFLVSSSAIYRGIPRYRNKKTNFSYSDFNTTLRDRFYGIPKFYGNYSPLFRLFYSTLRAAYLSFLSSVTPRDLNISVPPLFLFLLPSFFSFSLKLQISLSLFEESVAFSEASLANIQAYRPISQLIS